MKKTISIFVMMSLMGCSVGFGEKQGLNGYVACDVCVFVKNDAGDNLLDPSFEGNILGNDIYIEYNDETYHVVEPSDERPHRPGEGVWSGLTIERHSTDGERLVFGEFDTVIDMYGEKFTIYWGDGTSDEVKFDLYVTSETSLFEDIEHTVHRTVWLNDVLQSDDSLTFEIVK